MGQCVELDGQIAGAIGGVQLSALLMVRFRKNVAEGLQSDC